MKQHLSLLAAGIIGGLTTLTGTWLFSPNTQSIHITTDNKGAANSTMQLTNNPNDIPDTKPPADFTAAADKAMPAVVNITATKEYKARNAQEQRYMDFFGTPSPSEATGSGVIISPKGYIVTNNHVIKGATTVEVTLYDKRKFKANLIGTDANTDLAVLQIVSPDNLPILDFANSDDIRIGEWVLAIGNPFELSSTVTAGIISAKGRNINILGGGKSIESFIQTDAAVNPGNSGGALVNAQGELVGINTAIASQTGSYSGYSFAVPINLVKKVVQDLIEHGEVKRGFLGVMIQDVNSEVAKEHDLSVTQGVYVNDLVADGAASEAGMLAGDVIVKVNTVKIKSVPELQEQIGSRNPGDNVLITVLREKQEKDLVVKLKN